MKKLFAILMVLTLVAGASFAQVSVGGGAEASVVLFGNEGGNTVVGSGSIDLARISVGGQNEEGTFGGLVRATFNGATGDSTPHVVANAWWKPIDQLKIRIGQEGDGSWGKRDFTGWGFTGPAKQVNDYYQDDWFDAGFTAFYGGTPWGWDQLDLEITPVDFIGVNISLPYFQGGKVADIFKNFHAQVNVNLDFGNIAVTYVGTGFGANNGGEMYVSAGLGMIDNVDLLVGVGFVLGGSTFSYGSYIGIAAGLGADVKIGDKFGIKARLNTAFDTIGVGNFELMFDVLPSFAINDNFEIFLNAGIRMETNDFMDKAYVEFNINPYIRIGSHWGPAFRAGFRLTGNNTPNVKPYWSVPIGIAFGF